SSAAPDTAENLILPGRNEEGLAKARDGRLVGKLLPDLHRRRGLVASGNSSNSAGVPEVFARSMLSSRSLVVTPPLAEKPPGLPFAASTRWQGTMIGIGFWPSAWPTSRATSRGSPSFAVISP